MSTAAVLASETLTYAELDERVQTVASGLRALGLRRDDRVMLVMSDEIPMLTGILGAFRAGLVAVPVSTMFTGPELGAIMNDSGARAVLATPEFLTAVNGAVALSPEVEHAVLAGDPGEAGLQVPEHVLVHTWAELTDAGEQAGLPEVAPTGDDDWALWLYTSGTTGKPKAAMHRHANIRHVCETYGAQVLGITPDDVTFSVPKMFFAYGIGNTMFFPFSVGATTVLEPRRPTPDVVRERLEQTRPTLFFGVPTFYAALTQSDVPAEAFGSVRMCASAGEALPAPLQRRFTDRFGVDILDGIGSTEALHIFLSNRPGDIHPGTTGRRGPGLRARAPRRPRAAPCPTASRARCTSRASRSRSATGTAPRPPGRCSRASGWSPATPTSATTRATTSASAATATCSRPAASGSRPARSRAGCWSTPPSARRPWSASPTRTASTSRSRWSSSASGASERRPGRLVPRRARALQGAARRWCS